MKISSWRTFRLFPARLRSATDVKFSKMLSSRFVIWLYDRSRYFVFLNVEFGNMPNSNSLILLKDMFNISIWNWISLFSIQNASLFTLKMDLSLKSIFKPSIKVGLGISERLRKVDQKCSSMGTCITHNKGLLCWVKIKWAQKICMHLQYDKQLKKYNIISRP